MWRWAYPQESSEYQACRQCSHAYSAYQTAPGMVAAECRQQSRTDFRRRTGW